MSTLSPLPLPEFPRENPPPKLWLLMGGVSPEHEVSLSSALTVLGRFEPHRYLVRPVCIRRDGLWCFAPDFIEAPADERFAALARQEFTAERPSWEIAPLPRALDLLANDSPDLAFIVMHGPQGEDGRIQALLEMAGTNYTGSGVAASALAMDKARTIAILRSREIPVAPSFFLDAEDWQRDAAVAERRALAVTGLPCVVKPNEGGSSVGLTIARDAASWRTGVEAALALDGRGALCEKFVTGRELTCAVLEVPEVPGHVDHALPVTEIRPREGEFFDYHCKYSPGASEEITPAPIPPEQAAEIQRLALASHRAVGARGFSRTDFILEPSGRAAVLEINTIPGMTPTSLLPQGAAAASKLR